MGREVSIKNVVNAGYEGRRHPPQRFLIRRRDQCVTFHRSASTDQPSVYSLIGGQLHTRFRSP